MTMKLQTYNGVMRVTHFFTHHSLEHLNKNKCTVCVTTYSVNSVYMTDLVNITKAFQQIWYLFDM